jgi:diaminopimelate epimerase
VALPFSKMHGLGNDFVVVDCRERPLALDAAAIRLLGDRHFGVGFDQLLTIEPARDRSCAFAYGIWNTDGTPAGQCGNGLRCVVRWLARAGALGVGQVRLESPSGPVAAELLANGQVRADMGEPRFAPADIPIDMHAAAGRAAFLPPRSGGRCPQDGRGPHASHDDAAPDRYTIDVVGRDVEIGAVSMGNPHALVEVDDVDAAPVAVLGPQIEHAAAFPQRCNVGFAQVLSRGAIRLRVWERGVGETLACGSGACAAVAVLRRRAKLDADVRVALPGGELAIHWDGPGHPLWMTGPATFVFEGVWSKPPSGG